MKMRGGLTCLLFGVWGMVLSQSYVSVGIKHYKAKEYKEALVDFKEAEKSKAIFTTNTVGKLYFYLGMTLYQMENLSRQNTEDIIDIYQYLNKAIDIDSLWKNDSEMVFSELADVVVERGENAYKKALKEKGKEEKVTEMLAYIDFLSLALQFKADPEVELSKAEAYHEIGDLYFENTSDVILLRKAGDYYKKAIALYEIARYNDPYSKEIIKNILVLSKRMDDPQRMEEYSKLLELAGG